MNLSDLEPMVLKQIEEFFINYQKVRDIEFILMGHDDSAGARKLLERATEKH
jgi:inorganic pyrophosphatase